MDAPGGPTAFVLALPQAPTDCLCPLPDPPLGMELGRAVPTRKVVVGEKSGGVPVLECRYEVIRAAAGEYVVRSPLPPAGPWKVAPRGVHAAYSADLERQTPSGPPPATGGNFFSQPGWSPTTSTTDPLEAQTVVRAVGSPPAEPSNYHFRWIREGDTGPIYAGQPAAVRLEHLYPPASPMRYLQLDLPLPQGALVRDLDRPVVKSPGISGGLAVWPVLRRIVIARAPGRIELPAGRWKLTSLEKAGPEFEVTGEPLVMQIVPLPDGVPALGEFRCEITGLPDLVPAQGAEVDVALYGAGYWPPDRLPVGAWNDWVAFEIIDVQDEGNLDADRLTSRLRWKLRITPKPGAPSAQIPPIDIRTAVPPRVDGFTLPAVRITVPEDSPAPAILEDPGSAARQAGNVPDWKRAAMVAAVLLAMAALLGGTWHAVRTRMRAHAAWEGAFQELERLRSAETADAFYARLEELAHAQIKQRTGIASEGMAGEELAERLQQHGLAASDAASFLEAWRRLQGHRYGAASTSRRQMDSDLRFFRALLTRLS